MQLRNLSRFHLACVVFVSSFLIHPLTAVAAPPVITPLAQITPADQGKRVTVQGTVVGTENFSAGFKLTINDATAQVVLLVWADDWDHMRDSYHVNVGAVVSATGKVDVYRNAIEIIPERGRDVQVVKWARRDGRKYDLGALTGND